MIVRLWQNNIYGEQKLFPDITIEVLRQQCRIFVNAECLKTRPNGLYGKIILGLIGCVTMLGSINLLRLTVKIKILDQKKLTFSYVPLNKMTFELGEFRLLLRS